MEARKFSAERKSERRPFKPKPWSHQHELAGMIGKMIYLTYPDRIVAKGVLIYADQFTLHLRHQDDSVSTVFKHALLGYKLVQD